MEEDQIRSWLHYRQKLIYSASPSEQMFSVYESYRNSHGIVDQNQFHVFVAIIRVVFYRVHMSVISYFWSRYQMEVRWI